MTLSVSATHSNMRTLSNSPTPSPSTMLSSSASQRSPTQSSATLRPSSTGSLKFCECTGIPVEALNVFLAVPDNTSTGIASSTQTTLAPGTVNGTSLLAAPISRLTMWTSRSLNASLSVRRQWSLDRLGRIATDGVETLCWAPTAASVRGDPLLATATRLPTEPTAVDDTVTWVLTVSSVDGVNETPAWVPPSAGPYQDVLARVGVVLSCAAGNPLAAGGVSVTLLVPVQGLPQRLAAEVRASSRAAQLLASMVSGAGGTAGRVMATRAVVLCSSGEMAATVSAGPLGLVLWSDACGDVGGALGVYRGTIAGNAALMAVACAVVLGAALHVSLSRRASMLAGLRRVALPSTLLPVWVVVLPSTTTSAAQVMTLSTGCAGDVVCVLAGAALVGLPLAALV